MGSNIIQFEDTGKRRISKFVKSGTQKSGASRGPAWDVHVKRWIKLV
jgi:hypothetical protein